MRPARLFPVLALTLAAVAGPPALADESAPPSIPQLATAAGRFDTLLAAVGAAGLGDALASPGPFTVFAPTNAAFEKLPAGTVETLLKPENK